MAELPPTTPKKSSQLQDLLERFGTQSSAESATKTRRIANQQSTSPAKADPTSAPRPNSRSQTLNEELKMEKRRYEKEKKEGVRRSTRDRKSIILESDTIHITPQSTQRRSSLPPKLDTARTRLRKEIANKSKAKANNFLIANKDYFLPLLPNNNYISKLAANNEAKPIVEYEELDEQPQGVTAVMKPYQVSNVFRSFI